ncbi:MAG: WYL domain-containing protein [Flavobacteriales bacterium]|nr:WYL domain-containing protein [Flavobacteriales bacterium]
MPLNKDALLRYKIINRMLLNKRRPYPTMEDIRRTMEERIGKPFAISTIQKDIKAMKEDEELGFFAPIAFSRRYNGYYYKNPQYSIDHLLIDDEELEALDAALTFMRSLRSTTIGKNYVKALEKIYKYLAIDKQAGPYAHTFIMPETNENGNHLPVFDKLVKAIEKKHPVQILHFSYQRKTSSELIVHPYILKEYRGAWYLVGFSEKHHEIRTFGLDRILRLKQLARHPFHISGKFDPQEYFKHCIGITRSTQGKKERIHLRFTSDLEPYIVSKPLHPSQQVVSKRGPLEITLDVYVTVELESLLLSYGHQVTILSPNWLAESVRKKHLLASMPVKSLR